MLSHLLDVSIPYGKPSLTKSQALPGCASVGLSAIRVQTLEKV
jgi:hypothetical protein